MSKGYKDWGVVPTAFSFQNTDLGEVAAKLGYGDTYSRSGKVLFFDQFEIDIQGWKDTNNGANAAMEHRNSDKFTSPGILYLNCTSGDANFQTATRTISYLGERTYGLSSYVRFPNGLGYFGIALDMDDGESSYFSNIRIHNSDNAIYLRDGTGTYVSIEDDLASVIASIATYNFIKFTIDMELKKYISLVFNDKTYDLHTYDIENTGQVITTETDLVLHVNGTTTSVSRCYIDSVYYTIDEPKYEGV